VDSFVDVSYGRGTVGVMTPIYRNPQRLVRVDLFPDYIDFCKRYIMYDELCLLDLKQTIFPFQNHEFDVVTCIETIEHFAQNSW
jgi:2-polyprenyl-3-methyl-5-hydroxy-6-metoxy-1,4-benzoquinol methylase